jgi:hypothetical protein
MANPTILNAFLAKRSEWFSWYDVSPDEPNSIQNQIHLMVLSEISYRVSIAEHRTGQTDLAGLPILGYLLESGYFATQILAIRRLLDAADNVHSVARVVTELEKNNHLLTREVFVEFDGTPYDSPIPQLTTPGLQPQGSPFSAYLKSKQRHERFDRLAKVASADRSPLDVIHPDVFERLKSWLDDTGTQNLRKISNKYLAHAADKKSRGTFAPEGLDFSEVEAAQRSIVRVAKAIYDVILSSGIYSPVVPDVPLGFFGTVWQGNNLVASTSRMQAKWDELEKVRNAWPVGLEEDLCQ